MFTRFHIKAVAYFYIAFQFCLIGILPNRAKTAELYPRRNAVVRAIEKVGPAVVNINTEELIPSRHNPFHSFGDSLMDEFLKDIFPPQNYKRQSLGSGVIINPEGYILTNEHVVSRATKIKVTLIDNREFEARLVGVDARSDLAVIKIDNDQNFTFAAMSKSDDILIGETVIAIGNPFGLSHTVTTGIISAVNRSIKGNADRIYSDFIQLDASINPGNSGGPLLNINGELIGINTAIYQKAEGIGFAIPIDRAKRIIDDLINFGKVQEAWVGIFVQNLTAKLSSYFKYPGKGGIIVTNIFKKSPAEKAGMKVGDIIASIGGKKVFSRDDYQDQIASYSAGNEIKIKIFRDKKEKELYVETTSVPDGLAEEIAKKWLGITMSDITKRMFRKYNLFTDSGVVITSVESKSVVAKTGIRKGDVLRQINGIEIADSDDFKKTIISAKKNSSVLLLIQRGRNGYYVSLEP